MWMQDDRHVMCRCHLASNVLFVGTDQEPDIMIRRVIAVSIIVSAIALIASAQVFDPPRTSYEVWVQNATNQPIHVTAKLYQPVTVLDFVTPDFITNARIPENANSTDPWQTLTYLFPPGKRAFIGTTTGRMVYFKAHTVDEKHVWQADPQGGFIEVDMGDKYSKFTQRFFLR